MSGGRDLPRWNVAFERLLDVAKLNGVSPNDIAEHMGVKRATLMKCRYRPISKRKYFQILQSFKGVLLDRRKRNAQALDAICELESSHVFDEFREV